jgi:hypothetical protein
VPRGQRPTAPPKPKQAPPQPTMQDKLAALEARFKRR